MVMVLTLCADSDRNDSNDASADASDVWMMTTLAECSGAMEGDIHVCARLRHHHRPLHRELGLLHHAHPTAHLPHRRHAL
jgi:hypothetical protein